MAKAYALKFMEKRYVSCSDICIWNGGGNQVAGQAISTSRMIYLYQMMQIMKY